MLVSLSSLSTAVSSAQSPTVAASAGSSSAFAKPANTVRAFADYRSIGDVSEQLGDFLELNGDLPGSVAPAALTATVARQNLRALFEGEESQAFLAAAKDSTRLKSPAGANGAALAYFARGQGAQAFACLWVIADRTPQDPAALLNLAGAALAFRQANEAMALLAEAEKFGPPPAGAWAVSGALRADYLKGYALMLRGDYPQARRLLVRVVEAAPALSAASLTLALVEAKLGEDPRQPYLQGMWRARVRLMVKDAPVPTTEEEVNQLPDGYKEGNVVTPALADLYDVTAGRAGRLRVLRVPTSPAEVRSFVEGCAPLVVKDQREATGFREQMADQQMKFAQSALPKLYKERIRQLYQTADQVEDSGPAGARAVRETRYRYDQYIKKLKEVRDATMAAQMKITITYTTTRRSREELDEALDAEAQRAISHLSPSLRSYLRAIDDQFTLESQFLHGMMSHIGVPALRQAMVAEGESIRLTRQLQQLDAIQQLVPMVAHAKPADRFEVEEGDEGEGEDCSDEDAKWTLSVDVKIFEVEVSCRSVSFEVEGSVGPAGISAELGIEMSGTITGFVGPKGSLEGIGSAKGGLYVTATSEGIQDIGGKMETKASSGIGPISISHQVDEKSVSFLPGPAQGDAPEGLPVFGAE